MHNIGSIGHLGSWILEGEFGFGCFSLFLSCFLFSVARKWCGHKDLVGNHKGSFMCLESWFLFFSCLGQFCVLFRHFLVQRPFYIFRFFFLPIFDQEFFFFFAFLQSLIGILIFLFCFPPIFYRGFSLSLFHNLTVKWNFFFGDPSVLSSEGKGKDSYCGSRFMAKGLGFWLKRLAEGKTWHMSGYFLGKRFRDKGMPHIISMTHI